MKLVWAILFSACLSGCAMTPEQAQQFAEGFQQGQQRTNEIMCAPGSTCFSSLSPEVQRLRYCDMHPSRSCQPSSGNSSNTPSTEAGVVSHVYINGVYVTCVGTGVGVNCN
jgi:hypothetical protein